MGDAHVGLQARLMSQAHAQADRRHRQDRHRRHLHQPAASEKVGIVYGNPEVTAGGRALKYYSSVRIDVRRTEALKDSSGAVIGSRTRAKVVKNKVAPPFREGVVRHHVRRGHLQIGRDCWIWPCKLDIIQKSGAWFGYGETRLGQGRDNTKELSGRTTPSCCGRDRDARCAKTRIN